MAISNSVTTFPCSTKLSAPSGFSTPTRFFSLWPCSLTRKGGESSLSYFLRPDAAFAYPNLCLQPLSALGRVGSSGGGAGVLECPKFDQSQFDRAAQAQEDTLIPVTLELGGKDAFIVCEDVDVPHVGQIAVRAAFQLSGQNCAGAKRFMFTGTFIPLLSLKWSKS